MRSCDVAVVGLGLMGSAALYALGRRGAEVVGFDPLRVGEARGSSHGSCRVFRRFNFENPAYTALSDQAFSGWRALEAHSGAPLLIDCPVLEGGPAGSALVRDSRAARLAAGQAAGDMTGAEANAAFPAFDLPADWQVAVQDSGGILLAEAALRAFRGGAATRIVPEVARLTPTPGGVHVRSASDEVMANTVIVAAGPWMADILPELGSVLTITRQVVGWFAPAAPEAVSLGAFPLFILDAPEACVYGFPDFEGRGVKAAQHDHGPIADSDDWSAASDQELGLVGAVVRRYIPGAAGPVAERDTCLYTNTRPADLRPDGGDEFILDRLPRDPRIIVASACSGHGAKFATAIGEILADLAQDPKAQADPAFRLDRYSVFAGR